MHEELRHIQTLHSAFNPSLNTAYAKHSRKVNKDALRTFISFSIS